MLKLKNNNILFCSSVTALLLTLLATGGCTDEDTDAMYAYERMRERPMETTRDVTVWHTDSARIKAYMTAPLMHRYRQDENRLELPEGLTLIFYDPYPHQSGHVTANYGIRYIDKQLTELQDEVVLINEKGDTLRSEELIWEEQNDRVYSEKFVKVTTPEEIIYAQGFESDLSFEEYTFYEIKGTLEVQE